LEFDDHRLHGYFLLWNLRVIFFIFREIRDTQISRIILEGDMKELLEEQ